jgi:3-methyladenine DNA glycosylase AlkD
LYAKEADSLGTRIAVLVGSDEPQKAYALLAPVLARRTPFHMLDRIGRQVGRAKLLPTNAFLDLIASERTMGGWVVIGSALGRQLDRDIGGAFERCRTCIIAGDVWYSTDILGERAPGPALVGDFETARALLAPWRADENRWVRRAVGVAVHFWAKRSRGAEELSGQATALLDLLEPMFEEWEMDAVKGVGWGLKTLGKHYPELLTSWLADQVVHKGRRHRALMVRKATAYLSEEQRIRATTP